jgi:ribonuclease J
MLGELERAGALRGAIAIWSLWRGYLANAAEQQMQRVLAHHGVPLEVHHVSGHAYVPDLQMLVRSVSPECVIPIHTAEPAAYASLFSRTELRPDGVWWDV